ncbi:hypothetical protein BJ138DRAFT_567631 [Hygrophoropsis aurantiaca]|uniref:Uncharacterized protein n=1 Tax=Hygrophoropsis aurantiaca TaxID=72124 RepID=A0ACB8A1L2_9AGAM|nr:hypothetical protein BJ138DRAFT_567631 [Hygrophoropsis aurantiaca]
MAILLPILLRQVAFNLGDGEEVEEPISAIRYQPIPGAAIRVPALCLIHNADSSDGVKYRRNSIDEIGCGARVGAISPSLCNIFGNFLKSRFPIMVKFPEHHF